MTIFRIAVLAGTSFSDSFHLSADPLWRDAWTERIAPHIDTYPKDKASMVDMIAADPSFTMYDNYFSVQTYPAYRQCQVIDIPHAYDPKAFAYAFAKVKYKKVHRGGKSVQKRIGIRFTEDLIALLLQLTTNEY